MHKEGLVNAWEGLHNLAIECETEEDLFNSNFRQKRKDSWNLARISRKVFSKIILNIYWNIMIFSK